MISIDCELKASIQAAQARWLDAHDQYVRTLRSCNERDPNWAGKLAMATEKMNLSLQHLESAEQLEKTSKRIKLVKPKRSPLHQAA